MSPAFTFDSCYTTGFRKNCDTTCGGIAIEKRLKASGISRQIPSIFQTVQYGYVQTIFLAVVSKEYR